MLEKNKIDKDYGVITFDDGYKSTYTNAYPFLRQEKIPFIVFPITSKIENDPNFLTFDELEEMSKNMCEIGCHTHAHPNLKELEYEKIVFELLKSKKILEKRLNIKVKHFCCPYGSKKHYDGKVIQAVKDMGFESFVTTNPGTNISRSDIDELKRISLTHVNDDILFKIRISGLSNFYTRIFRKIRFMS
ncbi:MAG: polysaccharide deacetylase family protein [Candidatus Methanofastidiosia archaeon]